MPKSKARSKKSPVTKSPVEQAGLNKPKGFIDDHREERPGLHRLYVEWAVRHLAIFDEAIKAFDAESNINMMDAMAALFRERDRLVKTNAAYAEADKLIKIFKSVGSLHVYRDIQYNEELD